VQLSAFPGACKERRLGRLWAVEEGFLELGTRSYCVLPGVRDALGKEEGLDVYVLEDGVE
jgi:hypothetical protein